MNAIKGVLVGLAATGVLFSGAQAVAAPTPTSASTEASATVTGEVVAIVDTKTIKVKVDAGTTVTVKIDATTIISGEIEVGATINVNGKKVDGSIVASGIIVIG
ncbi:hypothetical protein Lesp02_25400 [Lentzea sp. NBRC 105346]|uniref:hypothetical protein n=1 Tax=Lentzea sp. NBRC 105346 TaxID=3032205 RepID=UPI002555D990|nr:hypothetical protein [Lentzea sp. NBRC 105346]GLZ30351.1 hypothetical protein Lesp02_25400 [Lentzea sp. NBRC 105346]